MLTYVINTSENKTFDTDKLFELAGYNKIRWHNCKLNEIKRIAEHIHEKQNVLGADNFRIAVLVDFFNFDRIRVPYGRKGYGVEVGVDMTLYMPYIEMYLLDNLMGYLEKRDLVASDFEIYYIQNDKCEHYDLLDSAEIQLHQILEGTDFAYSAKRIVKTEIGEVIPAEGRPPKYEENLTKIEKKYKEEEITEDYYREFSLYCTSDVSLIFKLTDYPYGADEMTFRQFWNAFRQRLVINTGLRRHFYITTYGGGASRAAFDTLSLSLYLVRMYEREEIGSAEGEMEVIHLESEALRDVLQNAWCKINIAKNVAKKTTQTYYSLSQNRGALIDEKPEEVLTPEEAIARERRNLPKTITDNKMSIEDLYDAIYRYAVQTQKDINDCNRTEFNEVMSAYLKNRDEARENDIEADFNQLKEQGVLKTTEQCPSVEEYNLLVKEKQVEISTTFEKVLDAEYLDVDYTEEKQKADEAFEEYKQVKSWMYRSIWGDIIFMILTIAIMVIPYSVLQLSSYGSKFAVSFPLAVNTALLFTAIFICAVILQILPIIKKLKKIRRDLNNLYCDCCAKSRYSFSAIRHRYEKDLIKIEQARYELRQLSHLYETNISKDAGVTLHRETLEEIEDCLSGMLNNLDVEPVIDPDETVEGEFDISKPVNSRANKVYQVFSIEVIERMFPKKGSD